MARLSLRALSATLLLLGLACAGPGADDDAADADADADADGDTDADADADSDTDTDTDTDTEPDGCASAGFSDEVADWSLPDVIRGDDWMNALSVSWTCDGDDLTVHTLDLTGDGRPDLVVTDHCDVADVGTTRWEVYENTGDGFESAPLDWELPRVVDGDDWMETLSRDTACDESDLKVSVVDLTGDRQPDLVVTDGCDREGVGTTRWEVYENTGAGFADEATRWSLPPAVSGDDWLDELSVDTSCDEGSITAGLLDMDGDALPDLVVTDGCDSAGVGTTRWEVYANIGDGFADEATRWSLPGIVSGDDWMDDLSENQSCDDSDLIVSVFDIDGDARPDLVVTDGCDTAGVGTARWEVYLNTGEGFADEATRWSLPAVVNGDDWMDTTAVSTSCDDSRLIAGLADMDGDARPDLLVTDHCDREGVGTARWEVYPNVGDGFADEATRWALPALVDGDDWMDETTEDVSCDGYSFAATATDLDGDGLMDLVVTDHCDEGEVGSDRWIVVFGECSD